MDMEPWIFLLLTFAAGFMCFRSSGLSASWKSRPRPFLAWVYGEEKADRVEKTLMANKEGIDSGRLYDVVESMSHKLMTFWVGVTLLLAHKTFQAFFPGFN